MERSTRAEVARSRVGPWEWLWRTHAVAAARADANGSAPLQAEYLRRAELAAELADRTLDPIDALRAGSALPLSLSLYRQATYWALLANGGSSGARDLREAFDSVPAPLLLQIAGGDEALVQVRGSLLDRDFTADAEQPIERTTRDAERAREFVLALIEHGTPSRERVKVLLFERWLRVVLVLAVLLGVGYELKVAVSRVMTAPDLAYGKPWRTSSKWADCHPDRQECGGAHTAVLFHTLDEDSPWFEIDLGSPQRISVVEVKNRSDCCPERALPLVVEVGADRLHFREVARQKEVFDDWTAKFSPVTARYVRLRVARHSTLHLERVSVRAK